MIVNLKELVTIVGKVIAGEADPSLTNAGTRIVVPSPKVKSPPVH